MASDDYRPMMSAADVDRLQRWHERASAELHRLGRHRMNYLGLELVIPERVFPPTPTSNLLGRAVLAEVRPDDRVLDMGTGSGVNAILAASRSTDVVAVDVNPLAVEAAAANAERNGVADRITFVESDVFDRVEGTFDLVVVDPPFRWFAARDLLELAFADEQYRMLTRFVSEVGAHLRPGGRVLLFFGTSGDMAYLRHLVDRAGFDVETVASRDLDTDDQTVTYATMRLTRRGGVGT